MFKVKNGWLGDWEIGSLVVVFSDDQQKAMGLSPGLVHLLPVFEYFYLIYNCTSSCVEVVEKFIKTLP